MKPRAQIEARLWAITGRMLNGTMIDQIVALIEECAADQVRDTHRLLEHAAYHQAVREFREHRARDEQARVGALMHDVIHLIVQAVEETEGPLGDTCPGCTRALPPRSRNCPHCGTAIPVPMEPWATGNTPPVEGAA